MTECITCEVYGAIARRNLLTITLTYDEADAPRVLSPLTKITIRGTFVPLEGNMAQLSPKRQQLLNFIREFKQNRGYGPSIREILQARHISSISLVQRDLKVLEREGCIRRDPIQAA